MNDQGLNEQQECTIYLRNLDERVDEKLLEELFTQVGPVNGVTIRGGGGQQKPEDSGGGGNGPKPAQNRYAFVEFADVQSVLFACDIMDAIELYGQRIKVQPRDNTQQKAIYLQLRMHEDSYDRHRLGLPKNSTSSAANRHSDGGGGTYGDRPVPSTNRGPGTQQNNFPQQQMPHPFLPPPPPPQFLAQQQSLANNVMMRRYNSDPRLMQPFQQPIQQQQQQAMSSSTAWLPPPPAAPNFYQARVDSVVQRVQHQGGKYKGKPVQQWTAGNRYGQQNPNPVSSGGGGRRNEPPPYHHSSTSSSSSSYSRGESQNYHQNNARGHQSKNARGGRGNEEGRHRYFDNGTGTHNNNRR